MDRLVHSQIVTPNYASSQSQNPSVKSDKTEEEIRPNENNWELFLDETTQLEYDDELFISSYTSSPNYERSPNEDIELTTASFSVYPSVENFTQNEQLLIEGLQ